MPGANHAPADSPAGNLLFQLVESLAIHGLLASIGRIRQTAPRSQARMVGVRRKCSPVAPAFTQHHRLSSRRCAHRRRVDGSGKRDGSLQCGAACSAESPARDPLTGLLSATQAVMPGRRQPIGQDREGLPARLTDPAPHPDAFVPVIVGLTESPSVADDRVVAGKPDTAAAGVPAELTPDRRCLSSLAVR